MMLLLFTYNHNITTVRPLGVGFPWEWKFPSYQHMDGNGKRILYIGNSHLVILWDSHGNPVGFPYGNPVGIPWEFPRGNLMGILWEFPQETRGNGMGMGIEIPFPRQP